MSASFGLVDLADLTVAERVARGVELLDERGPAGWRRWVDVTTLDVDQPGRCVLGQVYGGAYAYPYSAGLDALDPPNSPWTYGFDHRSTGGDDRELVNAEWRRVLHVGRSEP